MTIMMQIVLDDDDGDIGTDLRAARGKNLRRSGPESRTGRGAKPGHGMSNKNARVE